MWVEFTGYRYKRCGYRREVMELVIMRTIHKTYPLGKGRSALKSSSQQPIPSLEGIQPTCSPRLLLLPLTQ